MNKSAWNTYRNMAYAFIGEGTAESKRLGQEAATRIAKIRTAGGPTHTEAEPGAKAKPGEFQSPHSDPKVRSLKRAGRKAAR